MMVASLVLPAALFLFLCWTTYRSVHAVTDDRIYRSVDIVHEHALKVFQTVERSIAEVNEILRGMSDDDIRAAEPLLHQRLRAIAGALPQLQGIAVIGRDGRPLVSSSLLPVSTTTDLSDRDYFSVQRDRDAGTYVSGPLAPRMQGLTSFFFCLSQRRLSVDGGFNGVIAVAVLPRYFEEFYARIGRDDGAYFSMARADGGFLARHPEPEDRAEKLGPQSTLRQEIAKGRDRGIYTVVAQTDAIERRIGYRKLTGFPVYVLAGEETRAIWNAWRAAILAHLVFGLPATLLMFGILGMALRRTRHLYAEAERREMAEAALRQSQRLEAIGQLTGGVAHDFNNLLMVINGSVQRLRQDLSEPKQVRLLDMIATASQRGESLTRQLLAYSRRQTLSPEVIDLAQWLPDVKDMLARALRGDIEIRVDVPPDPCWVQVDPSELELAILNLAVNARDAMPNGGVLSLRVKPVVLKGEVVSDGLAGEFAAIRIADTGEGIPPEVLPRVFEPFFTTKEVGKGTGLGLSQVYGFAKQSGGTATLTSRLHRGTTITLYLPVTRERPPAEKPEEKVTAQQPDRGTVLVVEDNAEVAEVCGAYFARLGYDVTSVDNGAAALDLLAREPEAFDVVFADILMPGGMNGLDLARSINELQPTLPVLLTTGFSSSAQEAVQLGFVVLQKPYAIEALDQALHQARGRRLRARWRATREVDRAS